MALITLTAAAAKQIVSEIDKRGGGVGLRVGLKPVGCSGYAYTYQIADEMRDDELRIDNHGACLLVATCDLSSLEGSCLDYVTEGLKQSFQFANPNIGNTCGCGESFSLKPGAGKGRSA